MNERTRYKITVVVQLVTLLLLLCVAWLNHDTYQRLKSIKDMVDTNDFIIRAVEQDVIWMMEQDLEVAP